MKINKILLLCKINKLYMFGMIIMGEILFSNNPKITSKI